MKKVLSATTAGIIALAAARASAQVFYEPFDYSTTNADGDDKLTRNLTVVPPPPALGGQVTTPNTPSFGRTNQAQGTFWSRTGSVGSAASFDHKVTAADPALTAPAGLPDKVGNQLNLDPGSTSVDRIGFGQVITSGTVYYSFLLKFDAVPSPGALSRVFSLNTYAGDQPGAASVLAGSIATTFSGSNFQVSVSKNAGAQVLDPDLPTFSHTIADTVFVVGAYEINGSDPGVTTNNDAAHMWVNPTTAEYGQAAAPGGFGTATGGTDIVDNTSLYGGQAMPSIASFLVRPNNPNSPWRIDEVRVDTTWAGVTPRKDLQYAWNSGTGGNFSDATWTTTNASPSPSALGAVAKFGPGIASGNITSGGQTLDTLDIDNANGLTINGTGLTFDTNASAGQLIARQGTHTISAPLTLNKDLAIKVGTDATGANPATLALSGAFSGASKTIGKYGLGTLRLDSSSVFTDSSQTLAVRVGTLNLNGNNATFGKVLLGAGTRGPWQDLFLVSPSLNAGTISGAGTLTATEFELESGSIGSVMAGGLVRKINEASVRLSGVNTYTGTTTVQQGTLLVGSNAPSGAPGALGNATSTVVLGVTPPGGVNANNYTVIGRRTALLTDAAVTIGRNITVVDIGLPTLGGNSAHNSAFTGAVTLNKPTDFTAAAGGTVTFSGVIANGGTTGAVNKVGAGTVTMSGNNTYTGGTTVNAGTLEVSRMHQNNAVTIAAGAKLTVLESAPGLGTGHPAGNDAFVSRPSSLTINTGATLDITNNDVIIDYSGASPVAAYEQLVRTAYNVIGDWQGTGITSSVAALDGNYVVAIADNSALAAPFGTAQGGPLFAGQDVDLDTVLIKFTHRADINLDGVVTPDDSAVFGGAYDENQPAVWATGDMDYNGIFTPDDAAIFGGAYDESLTSLPEPASLGVLGLLGVGLARRRRS